jgi:hypothetical protein
MNRTSETWRRRSETLRQESLAVCLALSTALLFLGCISRGEIRASIWLNNGQDPAMCGPSRAESQYPVLWDHGFYRRLNSGGFEFISFCDPRAKDWFGVHRQDLEKILDETLPKDAQAILVTAQTDQQRGARVIQRARAR